MSITGSTVDNWSTNILSAWLGKKIPYGLYYYFVGENNIDDLQGIIGNCNAIVSCYFTNFFNSSDFSMAKIPYDVERFGKAVGSLDNTPVVYRITTIETFEKKLGIFKKYNPPERSIYKSYVNESRLLNFPYSYAMLSDGINRPFEIKYHDITGYKNDIIIKMRSTISDKGTSSFYIDGYKGDSTGVMEMNLLGAPLEIPTTSSAYANFSSTQKASYEQNYFNNMQSLTQQSVFKNEELNMQDNIANKKLGMDLINSGISGLGGNIMGGILGATSSLLDYSNSNSMRELSRSQTHRNYALLQKNLMGSKNAMVKDLTNTPKSVISTGSDVLFNILNSRSKIQLFRYTITQEFRERLTDYFTQFGYAQNRVMEVNLRSRKNFNYIKTVGCNIVAKKNKSIPKEHLLKLRGIFDNGIRIWHMDRNDGFLNYEFDNVEV